ncbi:hypothetical protein GCM10010297_22920 [Streptomyces malachitofuscus]|nr:hypothetical protein GCM10010297_22920 [Streptomyces malachitofuscus]
MDRPAGRGARDAGAAGQILMEGGEGLDAALSHSFRLGNLTALRALAMLWAADRVAVQ